MAASDDFPRGVCLTSGAPTQGVAASVTLPAFAGLMWVITSATLLIFDSAPPAGGTGTYLSVDGVEVDFAVIPGNSPAFASGNASFTGPMQFPINTSVKVGATSTDGTQYQIVNVNAFVN